MRITTVADMHGHLTERALMTKFVQQGVPDAVFLLGDNYQTDIEAVLKVCLLQSIRPMPVFGICGNKEGRNLLEHYGVPNLHMKRTIFKDVIIGGFGGALKYEENLNHLQFTDEECEYCLEEFPYCDILLTHDKPQFKADNVNPDLTEKEIKMFQANLASLLGIYENDMADEILTFKDFKENNPEIVFNNHKGLSGIGKYVKKQIPQIVLHGHLHDSFFSDYSDGGENCRIKCCFNIETFDIVIDTNTPQHTVSASKFGTGQTRVFRRRTFIKDSKGNN